MERSRKIEAKLVKLTFVGLVVALGLTYAPGSASATETALNLGSASTYGVLANTAITSATASTVSGTAGGDIGVGGATPPTGGLIASGSQILGGAAITALTAASNALAIIRSGTSLPVELGAGGTILPGAYSGGTFEVNGMLTLNGGGDANAVFIFRTASTLVTGISSHVLLSNGAQACNVFWQVGSSATLGGSSLMVGHVIAQASVTTGAGTSVDGQLIGVTGGVTLGGTTIVNNACSTPEVTPVVNPVAPVATPTSLATPATPVTTVVTASATLHVVKLVVNTHQGTSTASTFLIHVMHNGKEISVSPAHGAGTPGSIFILPPGNYVLFETPSADYRGIWSGPISTGGTITLTAGEDVTVTRTNYDIGRTVVAAPSQTVVPVVPTPTPMPTTPTDTTVNGGELPKTATPFGNMLILGGGLILLSLVGLGFRRNLAK